MSIKKPKYRLKAPKRRLNGRRIALLLILLSGLYLAHHLWHWGKAPQSVQVTEPENENRTIEHPRIVVVAPLSGPFKEQGEMLRKGAELAWRKLHEQAKTPAELTFKDGGREPLETVRLAKELAQDPQVLLVVAHLPMAVLMQVIPTYEQKKIPLVVPANSHQNLVGHPWVLPLISSDRAEGIFAAEVARKWAGKECVAVIESPTVYGKLLADGFQEGAESEGLTFRRFPCDANAASRERKIADVLDSDPAMIWLAGSPLWGADVVSELIGKGYKGRLLVPQSYGKSLLNDLFGNCLNRLHIITPVTTVATGGAGEGFCRDFLECYWHEPDALAMLGYDAVHLAVDAMREGAVSRGAIPEYFLRYDGPDRLFEGVSGRMYFEEGGVTKRPLHVCIYRDGKFVEARE